MVQGFRSSQSSSYFESESGSGAGVDSGSSAGKQRGVAGRLGALSVVLALSAGLTGCGLAAAPCRVASAGLKIVPLVGHVAAAPTDACASVIDP
ncbi:hypothetical protein GGD41_006208 [Paraburkholderia bryophila]|uniref:Uncharacterized protein n=1 Tax=Paraburkholderia bryophila TaxID=420952 RepID=A0A7Z0B3T7_9BURK|nr:hypothetical protein [Paraburkholderia bryophila]